MSKSMGRKAPSYLCRPTQLRFVAARGNLFAMSKSMECKAPSYLCRPTQLRFVAARGNLFAMSKSMECKAPSYLCRPTQLRFVAARGDLFATPKGMECCCKTVKESMHSSVSYFLSVKQDMAEKNNNFFPFFYIVFIAPQTNCLRKINKRAEGVPDYSLWACP